MDLNMARLATLDLDVSMRVQRGVKCPVRKAVFDLATAGVYFSVYDGANMINGDGGADVAAARWIADGVRCACLKG
ncbi:MAG: hypothetical protein LBT97_03070 [Planctomycetota bacterium]|jgi:hypothetical protein|nr:hypothetical protein [Planctomycetota bacterium]